MDNRTLIVDDKSLKLNVIEEEIEQLLLNQLKNTKLKLINLKDFTLKQLLRLKQSNCNTTSVLFMMPQSDTDFKPRFQKKVKNKTATVKGLYLPINNKKQFVLIKNIVRLEANSNYTNFYIDKMRKPIVTSKSLKNYVEQLSTPQFIRVHRSHLINANFIQSINLTAGKSLTLNDGIRINISRRKLTTVKQLLKKYRYLHSHLTLLT